MTSRTRTPCYLDIPTQTARVRAPLKRNNTPYLSSFDRFLKIHTVKYTYVLVRLASFTSFNEEEKPSRFTLEQRVWRLTFPVDSVGCSRLVKKDKRRGLYVTKENPDKNKLGFESWSLGFAQYDKVLKARSFRMERRRKHSIRRARRLCLEGYHGYGSRLRAECVLYLALGFALKYSAYLDSRTGVGLL
ncbi:hypothetical protein V1477_015958 [Vespula maculifrons]|uniref:Uncharacterized protein n=2 Tax=Vespula TaxID=7451 RepID=A0A834N727_VESVU|nr:hypothetical protein HZH66_006539 [Vespula vulgaris]